jgi:hypothetical protein
MAAANNGIQEIVEVSFLALAEQQELFSTAVQILQPFADTHNISYGDV